MTVAVSGSANQTENNRDDIAALSISGLHKTYSNGFVALRGLDLEVQQGDFFALLGPNGAGKSTTIGITSSLVNKSAGTVSIFGYSLDNQLAKAKKHLGLVPQEFNFNQFEKVIDIVTNQAGYYGLPRKKALENAEKYLRQLGLWEKRNDISRALSGGMKRRLMIARALVHEPKLLILDEPTAGVDIELRRSMWSFLESINAQGVTIILTTHYLEEAESLCRNIAIIDKGEIIENTSMRMLLSKLNSEVFLLDCKSPLPSGFELEGFNWSEVDHGIEVEIQKQDGLNPLFEQLNRAGVEILSMRNKANRLEELFVRLVENGAGNSVGLDAEQYAAESPRSNNDSGKG